MVVIPDHFAVSTAFEIGTIIHQFGFVPLTLATLQIVIIHILDQVMYPAYTLLPNIVQRSHIRNFVYIGNDHNIFVEQSQLFKALIDTSSLIMFAIPRGISVLQWLNNDMDYAIKVLGK